jgi:hypothetical protein
MGVDVTELEDEESRTICPGVRMQGWCDRQRRRPRRRRLHDHEQAHVTHYLSGGQDRTHLTATHGHKHNHAAEPHSHEPHQDPANTAVRATSTTTSGRPAHRHRPHPDWLTTSADQLHSGSGIRRRVGCQPPAAERTA